MTWSSNQIIQMINRMSPITTSIRTITRMSAKMVAEPYYGTALYSAVDKSCKVVAMSWMQWFRVPKWAEGPAALERPSGESPDMLGKPTLCLTLQNRGQHIRTDKSTSNVGTAQMLLSDMAAMKAVHHRRDEDHRQASCAGEARYISPKR